MSMHRILAASLAAAVSLTVVGCGNRDLNYKKVEVDELRKEIRELAAQLDACEKRKVNAIYEGTSDHKVARDTALQGVEQGDREVEHFMSIGSDVLFAPGSAKLTTEAKSVLSRVIGVIQHDYVGYHVRIDGFTDNSPVVRSKDKWDDNWDLSGGRAQAVLHYLIDHGIPAKDLSFGGFGENRPKGANSSEGAKAKNRRVEIVVAKP
jgi:chemotaxis protein MotB